MPEETTSEDYMPFIKAQHQRLDLVEAQLAILSERAGVPYQRAADEAPPPVRRLVAEGKRLEAIQELRAGGLSMVDAKRIVDRM
jgi:ribosomal protein L7/L12